MTDQPSPDPAETIVPRKEKLGKPPRFIVLVIGLVILVCAGWSVLWYLGTQKAHAMIGDWLAAEAAKGRTYDCAERGIGGYPFRVEVTCLKPSLDIADARPRIRATADDFRAVAQVWNLTHVIYEIDGPVHVQSGPDKNPKLAVDADWDLLQGSLRAPGGVIQRGDLAISNLKAAPDPAMLRSARGATVTAAYVEMHGRRGAAAAGGPARSRDVDLALEATDLVVTPDGMGPPDALDVSFVGSLGALPYPPPRDPQAFLAAWRDNGGRIDVAKLSATQADTELRAEGTITPDDAGRPVGSVTIKLAGPVVEGGGGTAFGGLAQVMAMGLMLAGQPSDIDGRKAVSGTVDFRDGQLFLGPVPLMDVPPVF